MEPAQRKLYGTCTYYKAIKAWEIETEPHVSIRLKRWFPRIDSADYGRKHRLRATPENCLDLQVFLQRYPMDVRPSERFLEERANEHKERMSLVDRFLRGEGNDKLFPLKLPPREYQGLAANMWLTTGGLLLADDVGLGKTLVAFCGFIDPRLRPALVVTLSHLPFQWASELEKFTDLRCHILKRGTPYDILDKQGRLPDVIISNYHKLDGWAETLDGVVRSVAFDECQELRHKGTQKYEAAKRVADSVDFRLGLSATPIYNYGGEIWNVCNVIVPDALGTWEEFSREWCEFQGQRYVIDDPAAFGVYARETGVMLRRTRKEVKRELPGVIRVPQWVQSDPEEFKKLKGQAIELAKLILRQSQEFRGQKMQAAGEFDMRMRQATGIAKAPFVADFVRFLVEENETPVVLYGWHRDVYEIWLEKLRGNPAHGVADLNPVMYTGTESPNQKEWAKQEFLSGRSKVMVISLRAGLGMDGLQDMCHICVFGELDWSPGVHEQCLDDATEILTPFGFKKRGEIVVGDSVAGFDLATGSVDWTPAERVVDRQLAVGEQMFALRQPGMDLRVTGGHRMVYRSGVGKNHKRLSKWGVTTAQDLATRSQFYHIPVAGKQHAKGVPLTDDEIRFLGWFCTDGSFNPLSGTLTVCQNENSPFKDEIEHCLTSCGFHFTVNKITKNSQWKRSAPLLRFCVPKFGPKAPGYLKSNKGWNRLAQYLDKDLSPLLEDMDERQLALFLEAVDMGDGSTDSGNFVQATYRITSGRRAFVDRLQSLCVRRGWRANIADLPSGNWLLHVKPMGYRSVAGTSQKDRSKLTLCVSTPGERVWCVSNRLGTLVVRRNGKTAIVGNCEGRLHRDGQDEPVTSYYLLADEGSDPVVSDVLGIKKQQIEGIRDPNQDLVQKLQVDPDHIKKLAEKYLTDHGVLISQPVPKEIEEEAI